MNESQEGMNSADASSPQPVQPASAVNAGFDAKKIGKSQLDGGAARLEVRQKSKRPLWFWIVLSALGIAIVAAIVWMVVTLLRNNDETPTELVLKEGIVDDDEVSNDVVTNYISQLQQVYDANSTEDSELISSSSDGSAQEVSKTVEKALGTSQGKSQADLIRFAEVAVAYNNSDYERAEEVLGKVDPDKLSIKDQIYYYAIAEAIYERSGDDAKAQEAFSTGERLIQQLCNIQECKQ